MRFSVYINQVKTIEWGLNTSETILFSFLHDLPTWANGKEFDSGIYYWVSKSKIIEELPMLTNKPNTVSNYLKSLIKKGLIERKIHANKAYIKVTAKGKGWNDTESFNPKVLKNFNTKSGNISTLGVEKFQHNKNTSDNSTIDNHTKIIDQGFSKNNGKTIQGFSEQVGETEIFDIDILKVWEYVKKSTAKHYPTRRPPKLPDQQDADAIKWLLEESKEFLDKRFCTAFYEMIIGEHGKSKIYNPFIRAKMMTEKKSKGRDTWIDEIYVHMEGLDPKWGEETDNNKLQMAIDSLAYLNSKKSELFEKLNLRVTEFVNNPTNLKPIKLIIKAGYTLDQIQLVIEHSVERLGPSPIYRNYITPSSIFNPDKFEEKLTIAKDWKINGKPKLNPKAANDLNWDDTSWGDNIDWSM